MNSFTKNLFIFLFLLVISPLFFYKLGQSSLVNWDEAWYAEISRNITHSGDLINLTWNGTSYFEHPPAGFWFTALVYKLFGVSEFWARFSQSLFGLGSLAAIYFLGKKLFNKWVGLSSAIALSSAIWFVYRARSGNLDITLCFFFLLTLIFAVKASKNHKLLIPFSLSLSLLFLTKSVVPFTIIPSLILIFWGSKIEIKQLKIPSLIFIASFGGYFLYKVATEPLFLSHYFGTGIPGIKNQINFEANFNQIKEYLHSGIGKWFWPGLLGIILGPLLWQKRFLILSLFFFTFFTPFIFSQKGHIWHLIPLFPIMILSFFGFSFVALEKIFSKRNILFKLATLGILFFSIYISINQIKIIWYQFIDIPAYISDEAILSKEAGKYPQRLLIDGDFDPTAAFYSQKTVKKYLGGDLKTLFDKEKDFLLITHIWRIEESGIEENSYTIIKKDRDKILILNQ